MSTKKETAKSLSRTLSGGGFRPIRERILLFKSILSPFALFPRIRILLFFVLAVIIQEFKFKFIIVRHKIFRLGLSPALGCP